ncbi:coiled-coil domain-containing protein 82 isoform X2 [Ornithorhynchus anatinus]|uniref:Coiled-coil domain containing 82 n=1 Tax=Ornithorhynchus anatinus TaxID=9258 RepID=A0A6I8NM61_ORNAN|nr:coiled-coil domain-containing protein 82 isoform X2 [Ornithorhynchus anatinus]
MKMEHIRAYETRRNSKIQEPAVKSRVDWRRTKRNSISQLLDSDEELDNDEEVTSDKELLSVEPLDSEDEPDGDEEPELTTEAVNEKENKDDGVMENGSPLPPREGKDDNIAKSDISVDTEKVPLQDVLGQPDTQTEEDVEDEHIILGKRKMSSSVIYDTDDSDSGSSEILVRKLFAKRRIIDDDECPEVDPNRPTSETDPASRKWEKLEKLKELSKQRSHRRASGGCLEEYKEESCHSPFVTIGNSDSEEEDEDENSLDDFIVEDEVADAEEVNELRKTLTSSESPFLKHHIPHLSFNDHFVHFQRVVKAFLINTLDNTFLSTLYDGTRQKRYAQDMLTSLHYLDDRFVQPRLENLITRSRWKAQYKERVECYPVVRVTLTSPKDATCQACGLHRYCKFAVNLSGKLYNSRTLETDDFMLHDTQVLKVGCVCAERTKIYHRLKHFKYNLYQECCSISKTDQIEDEQVKETVERIFSQSVENGWIQEKYQLLQGYLDDADFFQDEKIK